MKGYSYINCKSKKVKRRMEELYKPMLQQSKMPREGYLLESFARAAISEVLHFTSINYAWLATKKWRIRDAPSEVIPYKEGGEELTYQSVVFTSMELGIERMLDGLKLFEEEEDKAQKNVEVAQKSANELPGSEWIKNEKVLKKLKVKLQFEQQ